MDLELTLPLVPQPRQRELLESNAAIVGAIGGLGGGKTTGAAFKLIQLIAENPGLPGLLIGPTAPLLKATTLHEFRELCPSELITGENRQDRYLHFANDARLYYWSADSKSRLVAFNAAWGVLDEIQECERWVFEKLLARIRHPKAQRRQLVCVGTPSMGWPYDLFAEPRAGVDVVRFATSDNTALDRDYAERLRANYDPRLYSQMVEGHFVALEGLVYDNVDLRVHLVDQAPSLGVDTWVGVDLGYNRPAVVFIQRRVEFGAPAIDGRYCVVDEAMPERGSAAELRELIRSRGYRIVGLWVDPTCTADERAALQGAGTVHTAAGEDAQSRRQGIERVRAAFRNAKSEVHLFLSRRLRDLETNWSRGVIKDLLAYRWPAGREGTATPREPHKDGRHDHSMDALRYPVYALCPPEPRLYVSRYAR